MTSSAQNSRQVLGQKGTAGIPSFAFLNDLNTGIYSSGVNSLGIAADGTQIVEVTSSGVSITGSLVPSTALAVSNGGTGQTTYTDGLYW